MSFLWLDSTAVSSEERRMKSLFRHVTQNTNHYGTNHRKTRSITKSIHTCQHNAVSHSTDRRRTERQSNGQTDRQTHAHSQKWPNTILLKITKAACIFTACEKGNQSLFIPLYAQFCVKTIKVIELCTLLFHFYFFEDIRFMIIFKA